MRVAIVHDDLIQRGGAERVVLALHDIFPDAPIYTSVASQLWVDFCKKNNINLVTSFLQKFPLIQKLNRYYSPFLLHSLAFESFDFSDFDVVISSSARYAHNIITKPNTIHISYINSPGRMFWEPFDYFRDENYGYLSFAKKLAQAFLSLPISHLRFSDYVSAQRVDYLIANSKTPQARIKKYYGRNSDVIYPFVDCDYFDKTGEVYEDGEEEPYFMIVTRLSPWKRVDIAVEACKKLNIKLKIIGVGADLDRLKSLASDKTEFIGYGNDETKAELLKNCIALINTQTEDFGIVPLEAMACGKPVIAYGKGGALETVIAGKTGEFFYEQTADSLIETILNFDSNKYTSTNCKNHARKFDKIEFTTKIKNYVLQHSKKNN